MRRSQHAREGILVIVLGLSALGLGAAASAMAEPDAAARSATSPVVSRPVAPAAGATAASGASVHLCDTARHALCAVRGPDVISPGLRRAERVLPVGMLAVWSASYEPPDPRIELVHTASAARGRPLALHYIEADWAALVADEPVSLDRSARPRLLVKAFGA